MVASQDTRLAMARRDCGLEAISIDWITCDIKIIYREYR